MTVTALQALASALRIAELMLEATDVNERAALWQRHERRIDRLEAAVDWVRGLGRPDLALTDAPTPAEILMGSADKS